MAGNKSHLVPHPDVKSKEKTAEILIGSCHVSLICWECRSNGMLIIRIQRVGQNKARNGGFNLQSPYMCDITGVTAIDKRLLWGDPPPHPSLQTHIRSMWWGELTHRRHHCKHLARSKRWEQPWASPDLNSITALQADQRGFWEIERRPVSEQN